MFLPPKSDVERAEAWLRDLFRYGPIWRVDIIRDRLARPGPYDPTDLTWRSVARAARRLGLRTLRRHHYPYGRVPRTAYMTLPSKERRAAVLAYIKANPQYRPRGCRFFWQAPIEFVDPLYR
jgi:hypothetical protein